MRVNVDRYLARMGYTGSREVSVETLRALHIAHMRQIPFENLSIGWGEPIVLDETLLFEKIVEWNRGGFCYELNGMFAWVLRELGFEVQYLAAAVARGQGNFGLDFAHMTLEVDLGEEGIWLADVGFGSSFLSPLRMEPDSAQEDVSGRRFRLQKDGELWVMQQFNRDGVWDDQYQFERIAREFHEFEGMCEYTQTSPESHFTQNVICTRATEEGRISLQNGMLIVSVGDEREEEKLADGAAIEAALEQHFGIRRVKVGDAHSSH